MIEQYWEPFRSDEMLALVTSAFKLFTAGLIYVFNVLRYPIRLSHQRSTTISLETYLLYSMI